MIKFLELWLLLFGVTCAAVLRNSYLGGTAAPLLFKLIGLELGALGIWAVYWMVLYPKYFTPFRNLPTPAVSIYHHTRCNGY